MKGDRSLDPLMASRASEIYQGIISKLDLSAKATGLVKAADELSAKVDSLRTDIVSLLVVPANFPLVLLICPSNIPIRD